jgi:putative endonuclease
MKRFYVYILSSRKHGTLYTGVTSDLIKRIYDHKKDLADGFTKKYQVHNLVWFETHETAETAIMREKQIKEWERKWKIRIIEQVNPQWDDLYNEICGFPIKDFGNECA